jgi:SAM-dependent methyltransferase
MYLVAHHDFRDLAARYDAWYQTPLGAFAHAVERDAILALADLKPGERAFDIGCGTGIYALELARQGLRVIGLDPSLDMMTIAREKFREAGLPGFWVCGSAEALPFRSASADLAVAVTSLCFVSQPDRARWSGCAGRAQPLELVGVGQTAEGSGEGHDLQPSAFLEQAGTGATPSSQRADAARRARRPSSSPNSKRRVPRTGTQGGQSAQAAPPRGGSVYRNRGREAAMRPETMEAEMTPKRKRFRHVC